VIARGRADRDDLGVRRRVAIGLTAVVAARTAGDWRLDGHTLVVTLEPCTMCAGAIAAARFARLVFGAADPRAGAVGSLWDVLRDPRVMPWPEVIGGVLSGESLHLIQTFFQERRHPGERY
jgi:tRNA(adenine34) deaminase